MENDELTQYLAALEREGRYRVDATLKEAPHEVTQRVFLSCDNGCEQGPFIRKLIDRDSGMGHAYLRSVNFRLFTEAIRKRIHYVIAVQMNIYKTMYFKYLCLCT